MPHWEYRIRLGDVWKNDELTFEQQRNAIVKRFKGSRWYRTTGDGSDLHDLVEELADAEDVDDYDEAWKYIYDLADQDRAWIETVA